MKVRKAVIPAAGLGTRMLPATKAVPKEVLPLADRPAIQYLVEEAVNSGIQDIIIITSRTKTAVENYFDYSPEIESQLRAVGRGDEADRLRAFADMANIVCVRQKEMLGLGHAILTARPYVGDEPFAVLLGDDIILSERPVTLQLEDAYRAFGGMVIGVQEVPTELIVKYDSVKMSHLRDNLYDVSAVKEKPRPEEIYSNYAILGRYILTSKIFDILEHLPPGHGGEIQLTDAICAACGSERITAVDFEGRRFDTGNMRGYLEAQIEISLQNPRVGDWLRAYSKSVQKRCKRFNTRRLCLFREAEKPLPSPQAVK